MTISRVGIGVLVLAAAAAGAGAAYLATHPTPAAGQASDEPSAGTVVALESQAAARRPEAAAATPPRRQAPANPSRATGTLPAETRWVARTDNGPVESTVPASPPAPAVTAADERPADPEPVRDERGQVPLESARGAEPSVAVSVPDLPGYDELMVPAQSVIGLQIETTVTSERARVEDEVVARVTRDVRVGGRVAIPAGSKAHGLVTLVERGGRLRDRARLAVRFTSIVLADGTRVPIETEAIYREGGSAVRESASKIGGGAIGGAIVGGILGGARGAAIGGAIGAGGGTAAVMAGGRNAATLPSGSPITIRIEGPAYVTVER